VRSLPIRKDDEVQIVRGKFAKEPAGKVTSVYRRRFCIYIDRIVKQKDNGSQVRRNPIDTA
jgi:large subunit ribosomal protein L26e